MMSDQEQAPVDQQEATPTEEPVQEPEQPSAETITTDTEPGPVPYARFKQINQELSELKKQLKALKDAETKAQRAAEETERQHLEEQNKFKELYEKELAKREAAEAEARRLELDALKAKVAAEVGLPASLATRLQGETEDEIKVDAQTVLAALPKTTVNNDATHGTGGAVGSTPAMTPEEIQEFAARYGVDPQYVKPEMFKLKRS